MLEVYADVFVAITHTLGALKDSLFAGIGLSEEYADENRKSWIANFLKLAPLANERLLAMGLPASARAIDRLVDALQEGDSAINLSLRIKHIPELLVDELESISFFQVGARFTQYLKVKEPPFGEEVFNAFPSAIRDIECAGKCLAFAQGTACVFHLTRVMEVGLKAFARPLGIPHAPSWESYFRQIEARIGAKHASKDPAWKKREPFIRDVCGDLQIVKITFRNPTMHIVRHYTQDEAAEIYGAVRTFMKRLVDGGLKERRRRS